MEKVIFGYVLGYGLVWVNLVSVKFVFKLMIENLIYEFCYGVYLRYMGGKRVENCGVFDDRLILGEVFGLVKLLFINFR